MHRPSLFSGVFYHDSPLLSTIFSHLFVVIFSSFVVYIPQKDGNNIAVPSIGKVQKEVSLMDNKNSNQNKNQNSNQNQNKNQNKNQNSNQNKNANNESNCR